MATEDYRTFCYEGYEAQSSSSKPQEDSAALICSHFTASETEVSILAIISLKIFRGVIMRLDIP